MSDIIITTPEQLEAIIGNAVRSIVPQLADFRRKNEVVERDAMNVEATIGFLTDRGLPVTRSSLYNLIFRNAIPYKKIGRRVVFSRRELTEWIETRTTRPQESKEDAALRIAAAARGKEVPR